MADLTELDEYPAGIYQLEQTDPVLGGAPNEATGAGMDNIPHQQLAKRTKWLKARVDTLLSTVVAASTAVAGIVRLSTATNSTDTTTAATPSAVKAANDNAETRALKTTTISAGGLATGGGSLSGNRTITVTAATQAQAEAGTDTATAMTPQRTKQAVTAQLAAGTVDIRASKLVLGEGGGGVGMTVNDGHGNANLTFNHRSGVPDAAGNAGRITVTTDADAGAEAEMTFALASGVSAGVPVVATTVLGLKSSGVYGSSLASQAEAEAGVAANKLMTPERTKQALAARSVTLTGNQSAAGVKTFTDQIIIGAAVEGATFARLQIGGFMRSGAALLYAQVGDSALGEIIPGDTALQKRAADGRLIWGGSPVWSDDAGARSRASSGYEKLPSGLIIQWGTCTMAANATLVTGSFPLTFPTACLHMWAARETVTVPMPADVCTAVATSASAYQLQSGAYASSARSFTIFAIGH